MALLLSLVVNAQNVTVGGGSTNLDAPIAMNSRYNFTQFIYLSSEINKTGVIKNLTFQIKTPSGVDATKFNKWTIKLGHTSRNDFEYSNHEFKKITGLTEVCNEKQIAFDATTGKVKISFTTPFSYNGTDNLVVEVLENVAGSGKYSNYDGFIGGATGSATRTIRKTAYSTIDPSTITGVNGYYTDKKVPQVIIGFQPEYSTKTVDPAKSEVSINKAAVTGNGTDKAIITVQLKDAIGTNLTKSGGDLTFNSSDVTNITDNANGTYTAEFASSTVGNQEIIATVTKPTESGVVLVDTVVITVLPTNNTNVGSENCSNGTITDVPFYYGSAWSSDNDYKSWSQLLYLNSELTAATIKEIGFYVCTTNSMSVATNQKIYMKEITDATITTSNSAPTTSELTNDYTLVYDGDIQWQSGTNQLTAIRLSTPFAFSGTKNLLVYFSNEKGSPLVTGYTDSPRFVKSNTSTNRSVYEKYKTIKGAGTIGKTFPKTYFKFAVSGIANTFNQTVDTDWNNTSNWSLGAIPTATDDVIIAKDALVNANAKVKNVTVNNNTKLTVKETNSFTVEENITNNGEVIVNSTATNNGSLIVKGTNAVANVTYQRYLSFNADNTKGWHLIAPPVSGQSINALKDEFPIKGVKYAIAPYINNVTTTNRWGYYTTSTISGAGNFIKGKGYSVKKKGTDGVVNFKGSLNADVPIAITDGGDNPNGSRWNLIGNPYTAAINANNNADATNNFLKVNIDANKLDPARAGLYIWDGVAYVEKTKDDPAFYIAPGQGFFVHAPDNGGTSSVNFTKAMQTHQMGNVFHKGSGTTYPEIILATNNKKTKIRYIAGKTKGLDVGSDVGTFTGAGSSFSVFTHLLENNEGVNFAVQALPNTEYEEMVVPVGFETTETAKDITVSFELNNIPSELNVYIEDRKNNTFTRIEANNLNYQTTISSSENGVGRFYIHTTSKPLSVKEHITNNTVVYTVENKLHIAGLNGKTTVSVYNTLGKKITIVNYTANGLKTISLPKLAAGIYIVAISNNKQNTTKKIILK